MLMARINGAAPFYIDHGTEEVVFQEYLKGEAYLSLEIFRLVSLEKAKQLFNDIDTLKPKPLQGIGSEGRFIEGLIGAYLVEFRQNSFFIRLTISQKTAESKKVILAFARKISNNIYTLE
jgi:hypothetical protein